MYGQTEATARLSYLLPSMIDQKTGSIGKGIPGVELRVVNEHNEPVNEGETGEIIARGDNIMPGYYKDEESTSQVIKNGWLYTGDLATVDKDGFIYIKSRKKEIIKVRGVRISPKEIEETIVTFPGVIDCTVTAVNDEISGEMIKAIVYINDADKDKFIEETIKKHCSLTLAPVKIPQRVEFETKLVFNAVGKKVKSAGL
jgi:acyl-coenzyme A synthetase/AMP-(fatty) acid ligase